jgi:hypothetical protein
MRACSSCFAQAATSTVTASLLQCWAGTAGADTSNYSIQSAPDPQEQLEEEYFQTVPQGLDSADEKKQPRLGSLIKGPNGKAVQQCVRKCVPTCIRGGQGK